LVALALGVSALAHPGVASAAGALTVSPAPGTPAASPATQISVLGVAPSRIGTVRATGAVTGAHPGRMRRYSGGRGASFMPRRPFAQGERVHVLVRVRGRAARRWTFVVARLGAPQPVLNLPVTQPDKLEHFASEPALQPPRVTVSKGATSGGGSIFMTPLPSPIIRPKNKVTVTIKPVGPGGPMISDGRGRLVWFRQLKPPDVASNLAVQRYRGHRVLTWWQGPVTPLAFGLGEGVIANTSYGTVAKVHAGNGYKVDIHEFRLTAGGDALVTVYSPVLVHLPGTPEGKLSPVLDSIVQEIDVRTGLVVWEWHALGHIPLADSYATPATSASYDAFHINAIQQLAHGRVLISARDTSAIYEIDKSSGRIVWTLGGKSSTFRLGKGARFWFQHDARMLPGDRISMFDDQAGPPQKSPRSRGLILKLDRHKRTAKVARAVTRVPDTSAQSEGSTQVLPGGDLFVGFGAAGYFSQFSPTGRRVYDAHLPDGDGSYRTLRYPWKATPRTRPRVAARRADGSHVSVSASWNGATTVARWQVLAGTPSGALSPVASAPRRGFETTMAVRSAAPTFAVRALNAKGRVLATSARVPAR
jgi:hypothetical protein